MLAVEDLAANLGARRTPRGQELLHARSRFLIECIAADCVPIDLPCTYRSATVLAARPRHSTQLGFTSKCAVFAGQVDAINRALTPSDDDATAAGGSDRRLRGADVGRPIDVAPWIDAPDKNRRNAPAQAPCGHPDVR